jgi:hypothetical protein
LPCSTRWFAAAVALFVASEVALLSGCGSGSTVEKQSAPPPGDEITVTSDAIELGERLVGVSIAREDGRLYVLAGHYRSEVDRLFTPESAVVAAFDDAGIERWRTELDKRPSDVVLVDGDPWVIHNDAKTVSRIGASNGRLLGDFTMKDIRAVVGAFGSAWVMSQEATEDGTGPGRLVRVDPDDLSTTRVDVPFFVGDCHDGEVDPPDEDAWCPGRPTAGAGAVWLPLKDGGVAMIDHDTNEVRVIPVDEIGHEVLTVAVDDDVAYVASRNRVTSIVDGEVRATISSGPIRYLGRMDGVFGLQVEPGQFAVLRADDPMVTGYRQFPEGVWGAKDIDGQAWIETGRNYSLRRVELTPTS